MYLSAEIATTFFSMYRRQDKHVRNRTLLAFLEVSTDVSLVPIIGIMLRGIPRFLEAPRALREMSAAASIPCAMMFIH